MHRLKFIGFIRRPVFSLKRSKTTAASPVSSLTSLNLNKQKLPKQPVPDLKSTADRYLRSVKPLLSKDEYLKTERTVAEFIADNGIGPKLQQQLLKRYENTDSWMNEWFLHAAYLGHRDPLIVGSSPGTVGPEQKFKSLNDFYTFGARLIQGLWDYDIMVKSGCMKQEMARNDPLDMQPYAMILGTHRQPGLKSDKLLHTDNSKHIIIMSNNHFFKLNIVDVNENALGENELRAAIKDVSERSKTPVKSVGILTGNFRDQWAEDYHRLKAIGNNEEILSEIEGALFILCLDNELPKEVYGNKNIASIRALQSMTGISTATNSGNRWHDKTVQYIISPDGFVGMEYEHSPCEGVPVAVLHDHVLTSISKKGSSGKDDIVDYPRAKHLKFELDETLERAIENASKAVDKISMDVDMECFTFEKFGSTAIKRAKQSPDSFIQMAMQAAFYKVQSKPPAHYESAGLRRFRNTRTECIRSTSVESVDFAKIMASNATKSEKKEAMIRAIDTHKRIASEAATGQGVDRHLFGLKMVAKSDNIEFPEVYKDVGFARSTHFTLTSSQVPYKTESFMCYGPVVHDGYGCCYNPRPDDILIACSSYKSSSETCTKKFADALYHALCDMKEIAES